MGSDQLLKYSGFVETVVHVPGLKICLVVHPQRWKVYKCHLSLVARVSFTLTRFVNAFFDCGKNLEADFFIVQLV